MLSTTRDFICQMSRCVTNECFKQTLSNLPTNCVNILPNSRMRMFLFCFVLFCFVSFSIGGNMSTHGTDTAYNVSSLQEKRGERKGRRKGEKKEGKGNGRENRREMR